MAFGLQIPDYSGLTKTQLAIAELKTRDKRTKREESRQALSGLRNTMFDLGGLFMQKNYNDRRLDLLESAEERKTKTAESEQKGLGAYTDYRTQQAENEQFRGLGLAGPPRLVDETSTLAGLRNDPLAAKTFFDLQDKEKTAKQKALKAEIDTDLKLYDMSLQQGTNPNYSLKSQAEALNKGNQIANKYGVGIGDVTEEDLRDSGVRGVFKNFSKKFAGLLKDRREDRSEGMEALKAGMRFNRESERIAAEARREFYAITGKQAPEGTFLPKPYTLSPGQTRYRGLTPVASVPAKADKTLGRIKAEAEARRAPKKEKPDYTTGQALKGIATARTAIARLKKGDTSIESLAELSPETRAVFSALFGGKRDPASRDAAIAALERYIEYMEGFTGKKKPSIPQTKTKPSFDSFFTGQ